MNWLAHILLSEPSSEFRIGNLLPDFMNVSELATMPAVFQRGIACHRRIDAFTDAHPIVRRSIQRISQKRRRFAPILVDVFYDHFVSTTWKDHWPQPLEEFVEDVYESFAEQRAQLPGVVFGHLQQMQTENWLGSYREIAGIRLTLERIGRRFRRPIELGNAVFELEQHYEVLGADFGEFFPKLRAQIESDFATPGRISSTQACR